MKITIIGARTRSLRENRNWSQEDLARESGLKRPHVSLIETGERIPGAETLTKLADAFGVSVDYLLGRTDSPAVAATPNHPALKDPLFLEFAAAWPWLEPEDKSAFVHLANKGVMRAKRERGEE